MTAHATSRAADPHGRAQGIWSYDVATLTLRCTERAASLLGTPTEATGALHEIAAIQPDSRALLAEALQRALRDGDDLDVDLAGPSGPPAGIRMIGHMIGADGAPPEIVGMVWEVDLSKATQARERADNHLRTILETSPDGMAVIDDHGIVQSFSRAAERMFGYSAHEIVGRKIGLLMPEPDRKSHDGYVNRYVKTREARVIGIGRIVTGQRKDGSKFPVHLSIGEMTAGGRRLFTGFMHDLTEERKNRDRLQQLQGELAHISRLSALGEMGAALAHELNQPLAAISNYIRGCKRLLETNAPGSAESVAAALDKAADQALRAGQIIRRTRDFMARRESERRVESLASLVEESCALGLVGAREKEIALHVDLDRAHDAVEVDRVQVQQVLVNLLRNALEAMADSKVRTLRVASRPAGDGRIEVTVSDTGPGIQANAQAQLFQPFFTTKPTGTGIGLSISRTIVEAHGGGLEARNNDDGGATFSFTLPLAAGGVTGHGG